MPGTVFWLSLNEFSLQFSKSTPAKTGPLKPIIEGRTGVNKSGT